MKRLFTFFMGWLFLMAIVPALMAQDHLLITEFAVTPTEGEFIEIYNPTDHTIDLSNYYITDATFANGGVFYYKIVTGNGGGGDFFDFNARFPDGATIAPGEHQTIAIAGDKAFFDTYGVLPTYELYEDSTDFADDRPEMREATPNSIATPFNSTRPSGLSNSGEVIILYYWDGQSDLVQDVDYVVWGDKVEAVDKTGVSIDGPDADSEPSTYLPDTPIDEQHVVNADNDDDPNPHDDGMSAQRRLNVEDVENWLGGNGITGHDETSEDLSWRGGIWSINEPPTPNRRALGDSLTIADIQFIRADSIGEEINDDSKFLGDTLTVTAIVQHNMRKLFLGARFGGFVTDEHGGPWSGFFIIQDDSTVGGTNITAAQPGDKIRIKGVLGEFPTTPNTKSITQLFLILDPVTPIEFLDFGQPLPDPILMTPADLGATGSFEDPKLTERWESTLVRFENLTVLSNFPGQPGNIMTAGDESGTIAIDDYFLALRQFLDSNQGVWPGFPPGTRINITGFLRDVVTGGVSRTTVNPPSFDAIEIASSPPVITNITRNPVAVTSADNAEITAVITDLQTTVARASVQFRVNGGPFQTVAMTNVDSLYTGIIPPQPDGSFVEYFLSAVDDTGDSTSVPGDTSASKFFYFVRDGGLTIFDLQFTPFPDGNSGYNNMEVTVKGIVTTDTSDFSFYWIQDGTDPWSGIWVNDNVSNVKLGDEVQVTGTVQEQFNATRITNVTEVVVLSENNPVPEPVVLKTGDLGSGPTAESYEGMLVRVVDVTVTDPRPDGFPGFGEFVVDDGSGGVRVDDLGNWDGQTPSNVNPGPDTAFVEGDQFTSITGIQHFTFGNYKIEPRNESDVVPKPVSVEDNPAQPFTFDLAQNYPNPFNPQTTIKFSLAKRGKVTIQIYNVLGQKIKTLIDAVKPAGAYSIVWDGKNDIGLPVSSGVYFYKMKSADFVEVRKMLLLK